MSKRFNLFNVGFLLCRPLFFYNWQKLYSNYDFTLDENLVKEIDLINEHLKLETAENKMHFEAAKLAADSFQVKLEPPPASYEEYYSWLKDGIALFEKEFPMTRIDFYYFFYARKLAEIICGIDMTKRCLKLCVNAIDRQYLLEYAESNLKDVEYALFKLIAPAALLSGENRHFYFNTFYKAMCADFEKFKEVDVEEISERQINKITVELDEFKASVLSGHSKCIDLLKELGV